MSTPVVVSAAVEGDIDEAVVQRLIVHAGGRCGTVYGRNGKAHLHQRINAYNNAAQHAPWMILIDLDHDHECPPPLLGAWLATPAPHLCFRVAVREVEAWLMADAETLAAFLRVGRNSVPKQPETLNDPKQSMVNLARSSRSRAIQQDMVPRKGSGRAVGRAYTSRLIEYVDGPWRPEVAAQHAASLRRAIACLKRLAKGRR